PVGAEWSVGSGEGRACDAGDPYAPGSGAPWVPGSGAPYPHGSGDPCDRGTDIPRPSSSGAPWRPPPGSGVRVPGSGVRTGRSVANHVERPPSGSASAGARWCRPEGRPPAGGSGGPAEPYGPDAGCPGRGSGTAPRCGGRDGTDATPITRDGVSSTVIACRPSPRRAARRLYRRDACPAAGNPAPPPPSVYHDRRGWPQATDDSRSSVGSASV